MHISVVFLIYMYILYIYIFLVFTKIGGDGSMSVCHGEEKNYLFYQILDNSNKFFNQRKYSCPTQVFVGVPFFCTSLRDPDVS